MLCSRVTESSSHDSENESLKGKYLRSLVGNRCPAIAMACWVNRKQVDVPSCPKSLSAIAAGSWEMQDNYGVPGLDLSTVIRA